MSSTETVTIPHFLANWPWKRAINDHYAIVKDETDTWLRSFGLFQDKKSQDAFDRCQLRE